MIYPIFTAACLIGIMAPTVLMAESYQPGTGQWRFETEKSIALALADSQNWTLALPYLRRLSPNSQDWDLLLQHAKVELQMGNFEQAQNAIDRALAIVPDNPRVLILAADIAADCQNFERAAKFYEKARFIQPANALVHLALARTYFAMNDHLQAIALYEEYLKKQMPTSEALVKLSAAYEATGNLPKAQACLEKNLDVHPNRGLALLALERFFMRNQQPERAQATAKERVRWQKNNDFRNMRALLPSAK